MTQPLFTPAELDEQISAYKQALIALASAQNYSITTGSSTRQLTRADLANVRQTLEWLQGQRVQIATGGGPQILTGRPRR